MNNLALFDIDFGLCEIVSFGRMAKGQFGLRVFSRTHLYGPSPWKVPGLKLETQTQIAGEQSHAVILHTQVLRCPTSIVSA